MLKLATACMTCTPPIDVDVRDTMAGFTPLHFACMHTNKKMVKLLLSYGADTTIKTNSSNDVQPPMRNGSPLEILMLMGKNRAHRSSIAKLLIVGVADRSIEGSSKICRGCGVKEGGRGLIKLSHCKCGLWFCGKKCQKEAWKTGHKEECKKLRKKNRKDVVEEEAVRKETATADSQQQEKEEEDVCPVCIEALQKNSTKFARYTCCGKGIHIWCYEGIQVSSLSLEQKSSCPLCRTKNAEAGSKQDIQQLRQWVEKGKAWAQNLLGQYYRDGVGVDQSYQHARELYDLAASQGEADARYELGVLYASGQGVNQSYERAAEYWEAAARQGYASAQFNLGFLYANGKGVKESIEIAREWWMKSAEQGNEAAIGGLQGLDEEEGRTIPSFIPKPFECETCYRPHDPTEHKLRPCKRCHRAFYCGKECQVKHWNKEVNGHKIRCNKKTK